jgi:hypothetical protein
MNCRAKILRPRFLVLIVSTVFFFCASSDIFGQVKIAELKNSDVVEGCSCGFQTAIEAKKQNSQKFLFLSEVGSNAGWMNINGKDTKLKLVKTTQNTRRRAKVGDRFYEEYSAPGVKVRIDYTTKWVCPPRDESCEVTNYDVHITVTKGKTSKTIKAKGSCGC